MDCGQHIGVEYILRPWPNHFGSMAAAGLSSFERWRFRYFEDVLSV